MSFDRSAGGTETAAAPARLALSPSGRVRVNQALALALTAILAMLLVACVGADGPAAPTATQQPETTPAAERSDSDRDVLVALYHSTGGATWGANANWLSDRPIGEWHGVTTNSNGRVIELHLSDNRLTGAIPPELRQPVDGRDST